VNPSITRISIGDIEFLVRTIGQGPDVVVLHGGPGADHSSLTTEFDPLSVGRRLVYYDQRGCGRTRTPRSAPLGWTHHVSDLGTLLDEWGLVNANLLGYSWGGLLALLYATQHPDRIASLALVSPAPITAKERAAFLDRFAVRMDHPWIQTRQLELERSDLRHRDPAAFRQRAFELSIAPYFNDPRNAAGSRQFLISVKTREAIWRSLGDYDLTSRLRKIRIPALVLHGRHDPIPLASAERTAALLAAELEVFEDSGHVPQVEEPGRFVRTLDAFLPTCGK
jgi:proline iminopeptidase